MSVIDCSQSMEIHMVQVYHDSFSYSFGNEEHECVQLIFGSILPRSLKLE